MRMPQPAELIGRTVYDRGGEKVGTVGQVFVDDTTGQPAWATVHTGLFGLRESFVPLHDIRPDGQDLHLSMTKEIVRNAPNVDASEGHLAPTEVTELYRYYQLPHRPATGRQRRDGRDTRTGQAGQHVGSYDDPAELTRHEEQLRVGTEQVEEGRVRLRKYVVTEDVQTSVPVRHEEIRIEREPVVQTGGRTVREGAIADEEVEVVLHGERPVVQKDVVPVETVRLSKDVRTEQRAVSDKVRKERIDVQDEGRPASRESVRPGSSTRKR